MAKNDNIQDLLHDVADAIREKKGTSEKINPQDFSEEIRSIESGKEINTFGDMMVDNTGNGSEDITSVVISDTIETIILNAYRYFGNLKYVQFGHSISNIGWYAFDYCENLESVVLPKSIRSIGEHAFSNCRNLRNFEIHIDAPITCWSRDLLWNSPLLRLIVIPKNINKFEQFAIDQCTGVKCIDLTNCLAIPQLVHVNGFRNTTGQFIVPDNLYDEWIAATNWSAYADRIVKASEYVYLDFADPVVEKICAENIGDGIGVTQEQANKVTTFPNIFRGNTEMTSFDELERFENVTDLAFGAFQDCTSLKSVAFPHIKSLEGQAFLNCSSLDMDINLPSLMTLIGHRQFNKSAIRKVISLGSITSLSDAMFENCSSLIEVVIPSTCATINGSAFYGCTALQSIICNPTTPPALNSIIPYQSTIYVPDESVGEYKAYTNWAGYADKIKPLSEYQSNNE